MLGLIGKLSLFNVTSWDTNSEILFGQDQRHEADATEANVVTSLRTDAASASIGTMGGFDVKVIEDRKHALLLDLDIPAYLVPSSTPGHSHLYVDVEIGEHDYFSLLDQLARCGVIQQGVANSARRKGGTSLRLPWKRKGTEGNG